MVEDPACRAVEYYRLERLSYGYSTRLKGRSGGWINSRSHARDGSHVTVVVSIPMLSLTSVCTLCLAEEAALCRYCDRHALWYRQASIEGMPSLAPSCQPQTRAHTRVKVPVEVNDS